MRMKKNILSTIVVFTLSAALLTGCTTPKKAIRETATEFLEIVKNGSTENIDQYASPEVLESEFVHTFDSSFLTDNLKSAIDAEMLNEETAQRLELPHITESRERLYLTYCRRFIPNTAILLRMSLISFWREFPERRESSA